MDRLKICVNIPNGRPMTYFSTDYEILDLKGVIRFKDEKYGVWKVFDLRICEIEEVGE